MKLVAVLIMATALFALSNPLSAEEGKSVAHVISGVAPPRSAQEAQQMEKFALTLPPYHQRPWLAAVVHFRASESRPLPLLIARGELASAALAEKRTIGSFGHPDALRALLEGAEHDAENLVVGKPSERLSAARALAGLADGWIAIGEEERGYPLLRRAIALLNYTGADVGVTSLRNSLRWRLAKGLAGLPKGAGLPEAQQILETLVGSSPAEMNADAKLDFARAWQLLAQIQMLRDQPGSGRAGVEAQNRAVQLLRSAEDAPALRLGAAFIVAALSSEKMEADLATEDLLYLAMRKFAENTEVGPRNRLLLARQLRDKAGDSATPDYLVFAVEQELSALREFREETSSDVFEAKVEYAHALSAAGRNAQALEQIQALLADSRADPEDLLKLRGLTRLAQGEVESGLSDLASVRTLLVESGPQGARRVVDLDILSARQLRKVSRDKDALKIVEELAELSPETLGCRESLRCDELGRLLLALAPQRADAWYEKTLSLFVGTMGEGDPLIRQVFCRNFGHDFEEAGRFAGGEKWRRCQFDLAATNRTRDLRSYTAAASNLASNLAYQGRVTEAREVHLRLIEELAGPNGDGRDYYNARLEYATFLGEIGETGAGQSILEDLYSQIKARNGVTSRIAHQALANLLGALGVADDGIRAYFDEAVTGGAMADESVNGPIGLLRAQYFMVRALSGQSTVAEARAAIADARKAEEQRGSVSTSAKLAGLGVPIFAMLEAQLDQLEGRDAELVARYAEQIKQCSAVISVADARCFLVAQVLSKSLAKIGDFDRAIPFFAKQINEAEVEYRRYATRDQIARERVDYRTESSDYQVYGEYLDLLQNGATAGRTVNDAERDIGFLAVQRISASSGEAAMAAARTRLLQGDDALAVLLREQKVLAKQIALDDEQTSRRSSMLGLAADPPEFAARKANYIALSRQIEERFPAYGLITQPRLASIAEVRRTLKPTQGLLVIATGEDHVHSFAVGPESTNWTRSQLGRGEVGKLATTLLCHVDLQKCPPAKVTEIFGSATSQADLPFDVKSANRLYQELIGPILPALKNVETLFVAIDPDLSDLALPMMVTSYDPNNPSQTEWLADRYTIITLPSVGALSIEGLAADPQPAASLVGYGDPVLEGYGLDESDRGGFTFARSNDGFQLNDVSMLRKMASLPGTRREMNAAAEIFGQGQAIVHLGKDATEEKLKADTELEQAAFLLLSTHGLIPGDIDGLAEPGLVLTPPDQATEVDDGLLTASEAALLRLRADMVLLSACNSASSANARTSDSLSGLARAFLYAGARSLVASRWRVDDEATAALMVELLSQRRSQTRPSRARALQQAMRTVRSGYREDGSKVIGWGPDWAHPKKWAAFGLISAEDE